MSLHSGVQNFPKMEKLTNQVMKSFLDEYVLGEEEGDITDIMYAL